MCDKTLPTLAEHPEEKNGFGWSTITAAVILVLAMVAPSIIFAQKIGQQLVGKLEGPEIITDSAKFPRTYKEAPQLAAMVKAGKLPPVKQRIGEDPLVIKPVHEIGKYGGTWRRGFTGPADLWNGVRTASGPDSLLFMDYTGNKIMPNIAKGWEFADGGRTLILRLRRGMKWSDGHPFTADDIMFWFEDIYNNKELVPTPSVTMSAGGKPGVVEKVDAYTVRFEFQNPYFLLPEVLAGATPLGGPALRGKEGMGGFAPAHYLKQFHPKYVSSAELSKKVKEAGFDNWVNLFRFKNDWSLNPDLPTVSPWKTTTPANKPTWVLERNPYSIWVDTAGNQLPYIDRVVMTLAENLEVLNLRAIAGEYDFQERHLDLSKLPVFLENQQRGGYKVHLDPADYGSDMAVFFNMSYEGDPEIVKWFNNRDFRRALSLGIDRDQINETFWLGTGTPGSTVPAETNRYNPGPEYRKLWATYDPQKANEMLDKIGLEKKDAQGFRLRTDGKGRLRLELQTLGGMFLPFTQIGEVIKQQWEMIGVQVDIKEVERSLAFTRSAANEVQLCTWVADGSDRLFTYPDFVIPYNVAIASGHGPLYAKWLHSGGTQGKEPPAPMREMMEKWEKAFGVPEAEQIKLGKEIWKIAAEEVYIIGVVGLGPANTGVRIAKVNMGNVPERLYNSPDAKSPVDILPQTLFWK
jgi:peptide/nickel transport system substrate-binding protein